MNFPKRTLTKVLEVTGAEKESTHQALERILSENKKSEVVISMPEKYWLEMLDKITRLAEDVAELRGEKVLITEQYLHHTKFSELTGLGYHVVKQMIDGSHDSGFKLKAERRPGSRGWFIPIDELKRWSTFYKDQYAKEMKKFKS